MPPSCAPSSRWAAASAWRSSPKASNRSAQLDFLRSIGCHFGQGRLFGEPCTADELLALLARQAAGTAPFGHFMLRADEAAPRSA